MSIIEIVPDIWLGTTDVSQTLIKTLNIQHIINCDSISKAYLENTCQFMYTNIKTGQPVMLVCSNFKRSGLIVIAYLMKYGHMSIEHSINAINSKVLKPIMIDKSEYRILME